MRESPSRYGGIASALVLGIGMLLVAYNLPPERYERAVFMKWTGGIALGLGLLALAIILSPTVTGKLLFLAIGFLIYSGIFSYLAASNEITGNANYFAPRGFRGLRCEPVTRDSSPTKFRSATNELWEGSGLFLGFSIVGFILYRKFDD